MENIRGPALRVISLGWGVQSWALAAMSALGYLPPVNWAIHSDTGYERSDTYAFAQRWTPWLRDHGVPVYTVQASERARSMDKPTYSLMPVFTVGEDGKRGQLMRQCTSRWKIEPQRTWLRRELKRLTVEAYPGAVEMWMGITLDEWQRMKPSQVGYVRHGYPFVNTGEGEHGRLIGQDLMPDGRRWTRQNVVTWLNENGLEVPPKSACVQCPYRSREAWRELRDLGNGDWTRAQEIDEKIRDKRLSAGYTSYLTSQCVPLAEMDLSTPEDAGQLVLWPNENDECSGGCFW
jgi:hypothetical protein